MSHKTKYPNIVWPPQGEPCTQSQCKMDLGLGRDPELPGDVLVLGALAINLPGEEGDSCHLKTLLYIPIHAMRQPGLLGMLK